MSSHQRQRVRRHFSRTRPQTAQTSSRSATTWRENFRQRSRVSNSSRIASCSLSLNIATPPRTFIWLGAIERPRSPVRPHKSLSAVQFLCFHCVALALQAESILKSFSRKHFANLCGLTVHSRTRPVGNKLHQKDSSGEDAFLVYLVRPLPK